MKRHTLISWLKSNTWAWVDYKHFKLLSYSWKLSVMAQLTLLRSYRGSQ